MRISASCNATWSETVSVIILTRKKRKMDNTNVTYEHDNEHSGDVSKNENYVHREAEVNIKSFSKCNLSCRIISADFVMGIV